MIIVGYSFAVVLIIVSFLTLRYQFLDCLRIDTIRSDARWQIEEREMNESMRIVVPDYLNDTES